MNKKKKIVISLVICFSVVILITVCVVLFIGKVHIYLDEPPMYATEVEFVDSKDFIFVAKIKEEAKTKYNKDSSIPLTFYNIEVVEYLKGDGDKNEVLCFYGGRNYLNTYTYYKNNDIMPQKNIYYLFFTRQSNGSSYIDATDFVINNNSQKIELEGYDESKSLSEQNENITLTINRFKNIIRKEVKRFPSELPLQITDEELVGRFDHIFLAEVKEYVYTYPVQCGEGSDIPCLCIRFSTITNFKGTTNSNELWICGVDYWNEKSEGIYFPKIGEIFLLFVNDKAKEKINHPQVEDRSYVALMNYQMIRLNNYDKTKEYEKQNEEIVSILNKYESLI